MTTAMVGGTDERDSGDLEVAYVLDPYGIRRVSIRGSIRNNIEGGNGGVRK